MTANIHNDILKACMLGVLDKLLEDKSAGRNILWAVSSCGHRPGDEIRPEDLVREPVVTTRALKRQKEQDRRKKARGEVFTPAGVCRGMCSRFGQGLGWQEAVKARVLEITCGEAPFLASRYDMADGRPIPVGERFGLLDRKLLAVSENTGTEEEWLEWAYKAFESSYAYEFQGDSLLIARVNLLVSFAEHMWGRWGRMPEKREYQKAANIIAWNAWQMDGLSGKGPFGGPACRIQNWRNGGAAYYKDLPIRGKRSMKFDFIIGNPPYQEEKSDTSDNPIYNHFMDAAYEIGDVVELITPARFLFNAGKRQRHGIKKCLKIRI